MNEKLELRKRDFKCEIFFKSQNTYIFLFQRRKYTVDVVNLRDDIWILILIFFMFNSEV